MNTYKISYINYNSEPRVMLVQAMSERSAEEAFSRRSGYMDFDVFSVVQVFEATNA